MTRRAPRPAAGDQPYEAAHSGVVVELDEVERRAVRALADGGLVPPLRHRPGTDEEPDGHRRIG
jgi:hypothetical protein